MFKVQEGFGPIDDGAGDCWDIETVGIHGSEQEAQAHSERRYEAEVARLIREGSEWWKSYWVRVVPAQPSYYAVYEVNDRDGYDADYQGGFDTKAEALAVANAWRSFASGLGPMPQ